MSNDVAVEGGGAARLPLITYATGGVKGSQYAIAYSALKSHEKGGRTSAALRVERTCTVPR